MPIGDNVVEVPYCSICRRTSEMKWRKHVFSKGHQRAATEFFAGRVARFEETRARINSDRPGALHTTDKFFCVFCDVALQSLRLWVEHFASASHRTKLSAFCKHHRCDATQETRLRLCITSKDVHLLMTALDTKQRDKTVCEQVQEAIEKPTKMKFNSAPHVEEFLNSAAERLQHVQSSRGRIATKPTATLSGSGRIENDGGRSGLAHRATDAGFGAGLSSIKCQNWGFERVANIHSSAIPPWMVDTEEEYKRCNTLSKPTAKPQKRPRHANESDDIFSRLNPKYDEKTWLPNFGGVWQEGPRSKTRSDFSKTQNMTNTTMARTHHQSASRPLPTPQIQSHTTNPSVGTASKIQTHVAAMTDTTTASIPSEPKQLPPPVENAVSVLDTKKQLLMAQKERLRAKMAVKRKAPS